MITRRELLKSGGAALAACGAPALAARRAAWAQPRPGRKAAVTIALPSNPETVDPHQFRGTLTSTIINQVTESLLGRDPITMEIKPSLALSIKNVNPKTWELKLRQGVKFQNGEDFTAESVKFSIGRIIDSKLNTLGKTVWPPSFGQEVEIVDAHTVRILTKVPDPLVPNRLAVESMNMAPPKALAPFREKPVADFLIGTGAYKFVEFVPGDRIVLEANPGYWGPKPATPRLLWQVIPDDGTRVAALQRGAVDIALNVPVPLVAQIEGDPNVRVYNKLGSIVHGILLNARESTALKDRRVRQALNYAVDKEALLKGFYRGYGKPLTTVVPRQVPNAIDAGVYPYDPARAKQLLAEAGFANGLELVLWASLGRYPQLVEICQAVAGYWDKVGVRTNLQTLDWGAFNARASRSPFKDALHYGFINGIWDPEYLTQRFVNTYPTFRYYDAEGELRQAILDYSQEFQPARRKEMAARIQKGLRDEAVWVFLWQLDEIYGLAKKVKGFEMRPDHQLWVRETYVET